MTTTKATKITKKTNGSCFVIFEIFVAFVAAAVGPSQSLWVRSGYAVSAGKSVETA